MKHLSKGTKSIDEYMRGARAKADQLALLGKALDHEDLIDYVIDGLPEEYKLVTDASNGRETPMKFVELHEKFLNREADVIHLQSASPTFSVMANAVNTRS
ncbi:Retrovirus-related Pol polyprotein from transposon RE1 [Cardamine amara subsp. amara]|uniref:Retrovirus-related Pol polyprotein from transposon RE1 n=1 Tax=Cardamine amara subsp. amara TaxID=228776 RepID=A0ABD1ASR5_CARAN